MEWFKSIHPVLQAFLATSFTYFVTMLGAGTVFIFKKINAKILDYMMGFAGGVMIAASFWSLLAPAIEISLSLNRSGFIETAIGFFFGGIFIILSDLLLKKKENVPLQSKKNILITTAVTMHNIPEGMAIGVAFGSLFTSSTDASLISAMLLALGIGIQNFPEGACVSMPLLSSGASKKKAFLIGQASGIVEPIAGVIGALFALFIQNLLPFLLAFSAGSMIAVVCSELIPESFKDNKTIATLGILSGFIVMMVLDVSLG